MKGYAHVSFGLGKRSKTYFLKNILRVFGYEAIIHERIRGLSGIKHTFEAIGIRGKNILLVIGGSENKSIYRKIKVNDYNQRLDFWQRESLLSAYDVQAVMQHEGWNVDLMFFHNTFYDDSVTKEVLKMDWDEWVKKNKLSWDIELQAQHSINPIRTFPRERLFTIAHSIGACFLTLTDLTIPEIATLTTQENEDSLTLAQDITVKTRTVQYFNPPADELVLGSIHLATSRDKELPAKVIDTAASLGHELAENKIIPVVSLRDPIELVKELEKHKYISFESSLEMTNEGTKYIQKISKSAQESFIIKVLNTLHLPELAESIIRALKS